MIGLSWGLAGGKFSYVPVIPIAVYLGLAVLILVAKPYRKLYLGYRAVCNMIISIIVQGFYLIVMTLPE